MISNKIIGGLKPHFKNNINDNNEDITEEINKNEFTPIVNKIIDIQNNMQELYPGECVALGMIPMCANDIRPRLLNVLKKLDLPTKTELDNEKIKGKLYYTILHYIILYYCKKQIYKIDILVLQKVQKGQIFVFYS